MRRSPIYAVALGAGAIAAIVPLACRWPQLPPPELPPSMHGLLSALTPAVIVLDGSALIDPPTPVVATP